MGQYYKIINLSKQEALEKINLSKLVEFAYISSDDNINLVYMLSKNWKGDIVITVGDYFEINYFDFKESELQKDPEKRNLYLYYERLLEQYGKSYFYDLAKVFKNVSPPTETLRNSLNDPYIRMEILKSFYTEHRYFVNYKREEYIDLMEWMDIQKDLETNNLFYADSPVILLIACGNGLGGGDYHGLNEEKIGLWAFEPIGIEKEKPISFANKTKEYIFKEELREPLPEKIKEILQTIQRREG